jgi:heptosyltransferase I
LSPTHIEFGAIGVKRVLIVKLSSLGDVVHAMPVVHDILQALPSVQIDWVVEPGFASLVRQVSGVSSVLECAQRRWRRAWWTREVRAQWRAFRTQLQAQAYDAVLDLQGLTKSALMAKLAPGRSFGLANRTDGASFEWPARWLVDKAIAVPPRIHAVDRSRLLASLALNYTLQGPPQFGLSAMHCRSSPIPPVGDGAPTGAGEGAVQARPTVVFVHGTSRDDKLWPEAHWIALGQRCIAANLCVALPHAGPIELARAQRIAQALGPQATVWPAMSLADMLEPLAKSVGVIGVDSGISHMAVALNLPHVQLYNFPTAWRTGPQPSHGHVHQVSLQGQPFPELDVVWQSWQQVAPSVST